MVSSREIIFCAVSINECIELQGYKLDLPDLEPLLKMECRAFRNHEKNSTGSPKSNMNMTVYIYIYMTVSATIVKLYVYHICLHTLFGELKFLFTTQYNGLNKGTQPSYA